MWCNFEQSPPEDETISNAFSSRGIFKISSDDAVERIPIVNASVQNDKMVISIDKSLLLLEDEMVAKCSYLSFNAPIDVITISNTGNLIVCGLTDGEIHGVLIKGLLLFNVCIKVEDVHMTERTFVNVQQLGNRYYFSCTNGSVYCLSEIDEKIVEANLNMPVNDNESIGCDRVIMEDVTVQRIFMGRTAGGISAAVLVNAIWNSMTFNSEPLARFMLIAGSHTDLHFKTNSDDMTRIPLPEHFGGLKYLYDIEHFILALTNSGHLLQVCPLTRTFSSSQSSTDAEVLIEDMLVMEYNDGNIELLILTKATHDGALIKTLEFPSMQLKNELDVTSFSWLVRQPKCSVNLYYLTGKQLNAANIPTELEMILVSETHPSERFKKLIAKGRLEEAEEFGKQFELCLQPIYEAKAKRILIELTNSNKNSKVIEVMFQQLLELLAKIESKDFIKNHRMINLSSRHILEKYLKVLLKRLDCTEDEQHVLEIEEQLHRLKTLQIIDPYECDSDWQKFVYHPNLVKVLMSLFKTDIPTACLVWKRHSFSMAPHLNDEKLRKLLNVFPDNAKPIYVVQWLRQFIPTVSNTHPGIMPYITDWSIEKTRALQYAEHWPDIGLEFSTKIMEIFDETEFIFTDVRRKHERNIAKLRDLVNALQELSVLKTSYNLIFTLDNYLQDSMEETALSVLQRVHLDKLQSLVNDFLYAIFQEKGKTPIQPIKKYISKLVAHRNTLSNWLKRAVCCIELLHNIDDRLECALLVLQNSPVPWPDTVAPLIKLRTSTHPLALKISAEYEVQVIKMMTVKYGWPEDSVVNINLQLLMMRIVKMNLPDMIEDIRVLTKAAPEISTSANFNCCYQMVRRGQIDGAYAFFKSLKSDKDSKSSNDVTEILADLLENNITPLDNDKDIEEHNNLIEFFKLIINPTDKVAQSRYLAIKNRFVLRHKFNLSLKSHNELVSLEERLNLFDEGIERIIELSQSTMNVWQYIETQVGELCAALNLQKVNGIRRICYRLNCLPLSCALAYGVITFVDCNEQNQADFVELAIVLIAQQIKSAKSNPNKTSSGHLLKEYDPLAFPLAYELLTSALSCERKRQRDLYELIKYVQIACSSYALNCIEQHYSGQETQVNEQICKTLEGTEIMLGDSTFNFSAALNGSFEMKPAHTKRHCTVTTFEDFEVLPQTNQQSQARIRSSSNLTVVKFVAHTLLYIIIKADPENSLFLQLRNTLPHYIKQDVDGASNDFFFSLEKLIKAKEHDAWYVMAQYILDYQRTNPNLKIINSDFVSLQLSRYYRNAMMQKDVNFIELVAILIADSYAISLLDRLANDVKTDQQKMNLLTLTEMYNMHLDETDAVKAIRAKRIKHYYYMEFCQQDPTIKGKFNADIDDIEQLLKEFHNKQLNVQLLERMSRDFGFDYQKIIITQVMSILNAQQMKYEVKTDAFGTEELVMLSTVESMRDLCQPYINEIKNTELLISKLKQFIDKINTYFYELYLYVIDILLFFDAVPKEMEIWTNILHFLKHKMITRRSGRPGQIETDLWLQSQKDTGVLPKIARYRLPFKAIVEQPLLDILDGEINVENCHSWFPLIQMHTLLKGSKDVAKQCDYFCMCAVKKFVDHFRVKNESETWNIHPTNNAYLKSILRLVKHVQNPCKAFLILYFYSNCAPDGADQVEASYECWKYAIENESLINDPKCQEQLTKIKRKYPILKTQHLLYVYGLTDEKLMRLVENPTELINTLYHHELILKSTKLDINTVVKEIAKLHNLDVESIQWKLLHKWLAFSIEPVDGTVLEETFFEDNNLTENTCDDAGNAAENVIRANYILNSWPKEEAMQWLISNIYNRDGAVNTSKQLQMFECIFKLDDGSTSFNELISQKEYITIKCVHDLKSLGYNSSIEKFGTESCNKINILKTIWQRNGQNPITMEIMANICLGYDIYIPQIWNGILKCMVMFNMVRILNTLVDILSCKPQFLHADGLAQAWDCVLQHPLKNADQTRTFAQEEKLHKTLIRLQTCPLVHALNLYQFSEQCVLIGRPHMAAVTLSFCKTDEQRQKILKLILMRKKDNLRKEILELEDVGILRVILNFALKELDL